MRTLLFCLFMILIPIISYTQEKEKNFEEFKAEFQNEFDEHREKSQDEFNAFIDSLNKEYINLLLEAENEFSGLLVESFSEFKVIQIDKPTENVKPDRIQQYKQVTHDTVYSDLVERKIQYGERYELFVSPEFLNEASTGPTSKVTFQFLGRIISIDYDKRISQMPEIAKIDAETITSSYDFLRNTNCSVVLKQLTGICNEMNLNDWDYYCLINEFCRSVIRDTNTGKILAWVLLLESNYKVKIGYFKDNAGLLIATAQPIYSEPWFNINGERYYAIEYKYNTINTYDIDYFKGYRYLNIFHDKPIITEEIKKDKTINFPFMEKSYSIPISFDQQYVDYYSAYPMMSIEYYFALPVSSIFKESVLANISPYLKNLNRLEALSFLLNLVQYAFEYKSDIQQFNHEKYMVPEELLYYSYSDCDDRTIFFSFLVYELLNLDVIAVDFKGHICSAVEASNLEIQGNLKFNGKDYLVCDPTYRGAPPGVILPQFQVKDPVIIDYNKMLDKFRNEKKIWSNVNNKGLMKAENSANISTSNDGSVFLTGIICKDPLYKSITNKEGAGFSKAFVARINALSEIQWIRQIEGSDISFGYCISEFDQKFIYVFGYFKDSLRIDNFKIEAPADGSFYLIKLDFSGKAYWLRNIFLPSDSISQGVTAVIDPDGVLKYYMPNSHFPHNRNYLLEVDDNGVCYIYATIPGINSSVDITEYFKEGGEFDIVSYLTKGSDNLLKQNYPKTVSLLYTLFKFLVNQGTNIDGPSLLKAITTIYKGAEHERFSEVARIREIGNSDGITWINTTNQEPVTIKNWQAQDKSRLKISFINGNARIDVLNGIKYGNNQIWNDVNYIIINKTTGNIDLDYANQYKKKMPVSSQLL